jgi:RNA polymerase sigma-70 factor (ECF subfamily)
MAGATGGTGEPTLGDAAFDRLVVEHLPAALRFAIRLTGDRESAEDVVQDALVRAARGWPAFRGEAAFRTWFSRIVINAFRDRLRRPPLETMADEMPDDGAREPLAAVLAGELSEIIARHVSALPPRQREVLVLSVYEQFTPAQVAAVLEISEANVYSTLHLARQRLKSQLANYLTER